MFIHIFYTYIFTHIFLHIYFYTYSFTHIFLHIYFYTYIFTPWIAVHQRVEFNSFSRIYTSCACPTHKRHIFEEPHSGYSCYSTESPLNSGTTTVSIVHMLFDITKYLVCTEKLTENEPKHEGVGYLCRYLLILGRVKCNRWHMRTSNPRPPESMSGALTTELIISRYSTLGFKSGGAGGDGQKTWHWLNGTRPGSTRLGYGFETGWIHGFWKGFSATQPRPSGRATGFTLVFAFFGSFIFILF